MCVKQVLLKTQFSGWVSNRVKKKPLWERHLAAKPWLEHLPVRGWADFARVAVGYDG